MSGLFCHPGAMVALLARLVLRTMCEKCGSTSARVYDVVRGLYHHKSHNDGSVLGHHL